MTTINTLNQSSRRLLAVSSRLLARTRRTKPRAREGRALPKSGGNEPDRGRGTTSNSDVGAVAAVRRLRRAAAERGGGAGAGARRGHLPLQLRRVHRGRPQSRMLRLRQALPLPDRKTLTQ
jgi:hypothetical protein